MEHDKSPVKKEKEEVDDTPPEKFLTAADVVDFGGLWNGVLSSTPAPRPKLGKKAYKDSENAFLKWLEEKGVKSVVTAIPVLELDRFIIDPAELDDTDMNKFHVYPGWLGAHMCSRPWRIRLDKYREKFTLKDGSTTEAKTEDGGEPGSRPGPFVKAYVPWVKDFAYSVLVVGIYGVCGYLVAFGGATMIPQFAEWIWTTFSVMLSGVAVWHINFLRVKFQQLRRKLTIYSYKVQVAMSTLSTTGLIAIFCVIGGLTLFVAAKLVKRYGVAKKSKREASHYMPHLTASLLKTTGVGLLAVGCSIGAMLWLVTSLASLINAVLTIGRMFKKDKRPGVGAWDGDSVVEAIRDAIRNFKTKVDDFREAHPAVSALGVTLAVGVIIAILIPILYEKRDSLMKKYGPAFGQQRLHQKKLEAGNRGKNKSIKRRKSYSAYEPKKGDKVQMLDISSRKFKNFVFGSPEFWQNLERQDDENGVNAFLDASGNKWTVWQGKLMLTEERDSFIDRWDDPEYDHAEWDDKQGWEDDLNLYDFMPNDPFMFPHEDAVLPESLTTSKKQDKTQRRCRFGVNCSKMGDPVHCTFFNHAPTEPQKKKEAVVVEVPNNITKDDLKDAISLLRNELSKIETKVASSNTREAIKDGKDEVREEVASVHSQFVVPHKHCFSIVGGDKWQQHIGNMWAVGKRLFTNAHVIEAVAEWNKKHPEFPCKIEYSVGKKGAKERRELKLDPSAFKKDTSNDFAYSPSPEGLEGYARYNDPKNLANVRSVYLVSRDHATKRVRSTQSAVKDDTHLVSTENGDSGAGIFTVDGTFIGLHRGGADKAGVNCFVPFHMKYLN